jgi:hypothetical protein
MNFGRQFVTLALASALLSGLGCEKKKPQLPSQAKVPVEAIPTPLPSEISETAPPPPPPEAPKQEATEAPPPPPQKHRTKKKTTTTTSTPPATTTPAPAPAPANNTLAAARPPANPAADATPDPAIAADVTSEQLTRQKQSTAQLLDETEKTISGMKGLSQNEEETLTQIRSYVSQSRKATSDGDFERAYNLATKAHLLSNALGKK